MQVRQGVLAELRLGDRAMQIPGLVPRALVAGERTASRPVASAAEWAAEVNQALGNGGWSAPSSIDAQGPHDAASRKLSELILSQALRDTMYGQNTNDGDLASDTWRGFLADSIAREVSERMSIVQGLDANLRVGGAKS